MAKSVKKIVKGKPKKKTYNVGQVVRVSTQYDGSIFAEIIQIGGDYLTVRSKTGKVYTIFVTEII